MQFKSKNENSWLSLSAFISVMINASDWLLGTTDFLKTDKAHQHYPALLILYKYADVFIFLVIKDTHNTVVGHMWINETSVKMLRNSTSLHWTVCVFHKFLHRRDATSPFRWISNFAWRPAFWTPNVCSTRCGTRGCSSSCDLTGFLVHLPALSAVFPPLANIAGTGAPGSVQGIHAANRRSPRSHSLTPPVYLFLPRYPSPQKTFY